MKSALSELHIAILAYLSRDTTPVSRYQVLSGINQAQTHLFAPYSTGAVYHGIKDLAARNMIKINPKSILISNIGLNTINNFFRSAPFPMTVTQQLHWLLWLSHLGDGETTKQGVRRAEIEMIKFSQILQSSSNTGRFDSGGIMALNILQQIQSNAIRQSVLKLSANF